VIVTAESNKEAALKLKQSILGKRAGSVVVKSEVDNDGNESDKKIKQEETEIKGEVEVVKEEEAELELEEVARVVLTPEEAKKAKEG
jgi:hypothetical protein